MSTRKVKEFHTVIPFVNLWLEDSSGRILIGQHQNLPHKPYPYLWDFPGGKVDNNETVLEAVKRELKEETGYDLINAEICSVFHNYENLIENIYPGLGICFKIKFTGSFIPDEMINMHWVLKEELRKYQFTPWAKYYLAEYL